MLFEKFMARLLVLSMVTVLTPLSNASTVSSNQASSANVTNPAYVLGPGDTVTIWLLGAEDISGKTFTVAPSGYIDVPMAGRSLAAGKTLEQLKKDLTGQFAKYIKEPDVSVSITEFRSQPVSVMGSIKQPGVHQLQGGKSLLEVLSLAGGIAPDAGTTAIITRQIQWGPIPVPDATKDSSGKFYIAKINLTDVAQAKHPEYNIQICPNDIIEVPRARLVYVMGQVTKPGGYVLNDSQEVSALQVLSMAGGATQFGKLSNVKILRATPGSPDRTQITINLDRILQGKSGDSILQPDDILYVPGNFAKNAGLRALETGIQIGTGLLIFR